MLAKTEGTLVENNVYSAQEVIDFLSKDENAMILSDSIETVFGLSDNIKIVKIAYQYKFIASRSQKGAIQSPLQKTKVIYAEKI
ncbi:hypothetical protein [Virgibacillus alimentarius]|uniref:Uncharacterized protein n=1 Tax=Virgibacillus alimentarius TaxID=698769 RepID=A0ABS4SC33_9BACI|nr:MULTISPECIES: hypothetical protein [Virgibacillus]MBP2259068.1 hypothetical protein [Virgibacillus alimentarius]HLR66829.1 hypothetical protein [Virgibacillus sp.]